MSALGHKRTITAFFVAPHESAIEPKADISILHRTCLLSGAKRTSCFALQIAAFDPSGHTAQFFKLSDLVMQSVATSWEATYTHEVARTKPGVEKGRAELQPKVGSSWFVRELFGLAGRCGIRANRKLKPSTTTQITTPSNATAEINCPLNAEISVALPLNSQTAAARFNAKRISAASMRPRSPFSTDHTAARA